MKPHKTEIYILKRSELPWGDYGEILVHGMTRHLDKCDSFLQLERTGPFIPPVTMPGIHDLIISDDVRKDLVRQISSLQFAPIKKARIVRLDWERWSRTLPEPCEYPKSGEPEDYILEREHDSSLSDQLGPLWQIIPAITPEIQLERRFNVAAYQNEHFVCASEFGGYAFISGEFKSILSRHAKEYIDFERVRV